MEYDKRQQWLLDDETQFPLPIFPSLDAPTVMTRHGKPYHKDPDEHHFFFPRKTFTDENLPPGGKIVRVSRIQLVRRYHHDAAHRLMAPPPEIADVQRQFGMSVLALSEFIPREAIDVRGDDPVARAMNDRQYDLLRDLTRVDFDRSYHSVVGRFFLGVITMQHAHEVDELTRCEFLETKHAKRKKDLALNIIKCMSRQAVEPINPTISELKKQGEIPHTQQSAYKTVVHYARRAKNAPSYLEEVLRAA